MIENTYSEVIYSETLKKQSTHSINNLKMRTPLKFKIKIMQTVIDLVNLNINKVGLIYYL